MSNAVRNLMLWSVFLALGTITQLAFKVASKPLENMDFGLKWLRVASSSPAFVLAVACYLATFALWIAILQRTPLSRAFLLTALVYVTVTVGSALWLGESINRAQVVGIGLVITGIAMLGIGCRVRDGDA
jgi:drug/metabolite transporter (DMT)-like permease